MSSEARQDQQSHPPGSRSDITSNRKLLLFSLITLLVAAIIALFARDIAAVSSFRRLFGSSTRAARSAAPLSSVAAAASAKTKVSSGLEGSTANMKTPVYFLSHGGVC